MIGVGIKMKDRVYADVQLMIEEHQDNVCTCGHPETHTLEGFIEHMLIQVLVNWKIEKSKEERHKRVSEEMIKMIKEIRGSGRGGEEGEGEEEEEVERELEEIEKANAVLGLDTANGAGILAMAAGAIPMDGTEEGTEIALRVAMERMRRMKEILGKEKERVEEWEKEYRESE